MKKLLLFMSALLLLLPVKVMAKNYNFGGYYCDAKQDLGDGTFKMVCHIIATTDYDINHVEGELILKNVTVEDIKTSDDWISENGLSTSVSFKSTRYHSGSFAIADITYRGNLNNTECEASFNPILADKITENFVCAIVDDKYYGKDGLMVTEEVYLKECCHYTCTILDNKYYFDSKGDIVDYNTFISDCSTTTTVVNPQTGVDYGYIILPLGILSIVGIIKFCKKNSKIYKI